MSENHTESLSFPRQFFNFCRDIPMGYPWDFSGTGTPGSFELCTPNKGSLRLFRRLGYGKSTDIQPDSHGCFTELLG